jgi:Adenylate and Guanylate cyclase catalytic domain
MTEMEPPVFRTTRASILQNLLLIYFPKLQSWYVNVSVDLVVLVSSASCYTCVWCFLQFADIVGFTAWSSVREPSQVFILLETMYAAFDLIARRRRIFKVETIGDCYVAVAGLPEPRKDHAVAMAKFATDVLKKVHDLTRKLEVTLGPDTGDLTVRIGLHSGKQSSTVRVDGLLCLDRSLLFFIPNRTRTCYGWCAERRTIALPAVWRHDEYCRKNGASWRKGQDPGQPRDC